MRDLCSGLRAFGPLLIALGIGSPALADSVVDAPLVVTAWDGARVVVTPEVTVDVLVKLRVEHGDDDFWIDSPRASASSAAPFAFDIAWPDLSFKGDLAAAPALVTGFVHVYASTGETLGVAVIEPRLWFADEPMTTFRQSDFLALTGVSTEAAVIGASPEAVLTGEVTP